MRLAYLGLCLCVVATTAGGCKKSRPHIDRAHFQDILDQMQRGRLAEAEADLRTYLEENPEDLHMQVMLAQVLSEQGRFEESLALLDTALAELPSPPTKALDLLVARKGYTFRALSRSKHRGPKAALPDAETLVAIAPESAMSWGLAGYIYSIVGDYPKAQSALDTALTRSPEERELGSLFTTQAALLEAQGRFDEARTFWRKAALHPMPWSVGPALKLVLIDGYEAPLRTLKTKGPWYQALQSFGLGQLDEAGFQSVADSWPWLPRRLEKKSDAALIMGEFALADGRPDDARAHFEKVLALNCQGDLSVALARQYLKALAPEVREPGSGE